MANQSDILSDEFDSNPSFNTGLISIGRTKGGFTKISSIHQHTREITKEDKICIKKRYLCNYYSSDDLEGWHASTIGLCGHLKRIHDTTWS